MEAAGVGYTDIVRLLLKYGACVGQKSTTGNTALHYAATAGHLECVSLLLQYKSPMEVQNETGHTPLMEATSNGHIDVARCLIRHGCDINTHSTEFKESALTLASYKVSSRNKPLVRPLPSRWFYVVGKRQFTAARIVTMQDLLTPCGSTSLETGSPVSSNRSCKPLPLQSTLYERS